MYSRQGCALVRLQAAREGGRAAPTSGLVSASRQSRVFREDRNDRNRPCRMSGQVRTSGPLLHGSPPSPPHTRLVFTIEDCNRSADTAGFNGRVFSMGEETAFAVRRVSPLLSRLEQRLRISVESCLRRISVL